MALPAISSSVKWIVCLSLYFLCLIVSSMRGVEFERSLYRVHDGVDRLTELTDGSLAQSIGSGSTWVVWYRSGSGLQGQVNGGEASAEDKIDDTHEQFLQMTAQLVDGESVNFGFVEQSKSPSTFKTRGVNVGSMVVYRNGKQIPFVGYRSPDILVSFLKKISGPLVTVIDGKPAKRDFNRVRTTKVVGFFEQNSLAYKEFEAAALAHQPNIPFYAVFDPEVSDHVKVSNVTGSVQIVREEDKVRVDLATNPASAADISRALAADGRDIFRHVSAEDLHSLLEADDNVQRLFVFSRKSSGEARDFYKALQKAARSYVNRPALEIRVIDPEQLPMVVPFWEATFKIDTNKAMIGKVDFETGWSTWLDAAQIASAVDTADRQLALENWINLWAFGAKPGEEPPQLPPPGHTQGAAAATEGQLKSDIIQITREEVEMDDVKNVIQSDDSSTDDLNGFDDDTNPSESSSREEL